MPMIDPRHEWIQTYTGKRFHILNPSLEQIDILDIAHASSQKPRFAGHLDNRFTIAQHELVMARLVPPEYALEALLHDGNESYLPDLPTPIKNLMEAHGFNYREIVEKPMDTIIFSRFGMKYPLTPEVKHVIKKWDWISVLMERELFARARLPWENVPYEKYDIDPTLKSYDKSIWINMQKLPDDEVKSQYLQAFKYLAKERYGMDCLPKFFDIKEQE